MLVLPQDKGVYKCFPKAVFELVIFRNFRASSQNGLLMIGSGIGV